MTYYKIGYLAIGMSLLMFCSMIGCKADHVKKIDNLTPLLIGRWEVSKAKRDNRDTKSLNSGFLLFLEGQRLYTNFLNTSDTLQYEVEEQRIVIPSQDIVFNVSTITTDKLVLISRINKHNLEIEFMPVRS